MVTKGISLFMLIYFPGFLHWSIHTCFIHFLRIIKTALYCWLLLIAAEYLLVVLLFDLRCNGTKNRDLHMKWIFIVMNFSEAFCISLIASTKKYGIFHTEKFRILFSGGFLWQDSYDFNDSQDWVNFLIVRKLGILLEISFFYNVN